jgi:hypothetical protein
MTPTDFNTTNCKKSFMNVISSFITYSQSTILMKPRKTSFNHPAIYTQPTAIFRPSLSKMRYNSSLTKLITMWLTVITSVTKNAFRALNWSSYLACYRRNAIDQHQHLSYIMPISSGQLHRQRDTVGICYQMVFRAFFAAIRGIWPCFRPPKTARTDAESTTAREKSISSACRNLFSKTWWIFSHTAVFCQSRKQRQQVMPEPQPNSLGRSSQAMPVLRTKRIPVSAALSGRGFRPGYRNLRFFFGISGSMISHNSSSSIGFAMSSLLALICVTQLLMLSVIDGNIISFC